MSAATFDTLQYAKQLRSVDVPERQAEVEAEVLGKALEARDKALAALEVKVQGLVADTKQMATKEDVSKLDTKIELLRKDVETSKKDIIIWLGGGLIAAVTIILGAIGLAARYLSQAT